MDRVHRHDASHHRPHIDLAAEPRPTIPVSRLLSPLTSPLFSCSLDDGTPLSEALLPGPSGAGATTDSAGRRWLAAPARPPLEWSDVAVGMMVGLSHGALGASPPDPAKAPRSRPQLEARLLQLGREGWMAHTPGLGLLLLADCKGAAAASSGPQWLLRPVPASSAGAGGGVGGAQLRWRCYTGPAAKVGVSLWRKTAALLRALWDEYSDRRYFLKLDADAFLLPGALLAFLGFLDGALHPSSPAYFGNNRIASAEKFCIHRRCLLRSAAWQALRVAGPRGLYVPGALSAQLARDIPFGVIMFLAYESMRGALQRRHGGEPTPYLGALCGALAGSVATLATNPVDVLKTRIMTGGASSSQLLAVASSILSAEGPGAFYAGLLPRLLHKTPAAGVFWLLYETFKKLLGAS